MVMSLEHKNQDSVQQALHRESQSSIAYPSRTIVHAKLEMTKPGDHDEQEADAVATAIMSGGKISRKISSGASGSSGIAVSQQMESLLNHLQGGGQAMPEGLRNMMESGFGQDFGQVRLHTDSEAASMSSSIHAKAFTHGNDIYFNRGQFAPETSEGQHLVAHELTHVVQTNTKVARTPDEAYQISQVINDSELCPLDDDITCAMNLIVQVYFGENKNYGNENDRELERLLLFLPPENFYTLLKTNVESFSHFIVLNKEAFKRVYKRFRNVFLTFKKENPRAYSEMISLSGTCDDEILGAYNSALKELGLEEDWGLIQYEKPDPATRIRKSEVKQNLNYCLLRADDLIDAINNQKKLDNTLAGKIANFSIFNGEDYEPDELIAILKEAKKKLKDLKRSKESIDAIDIGVQAILTVIRLVDARLAMHRNNAIEGTGDVITGLTVTKNACFAIAGAIAVGLFAPAGAPLSTEILANIGVNAAIGFGDSLATEISKGGNGISGGFEDASLEVLKGTAIGAGAGVLGMAVGKGADKMIPGLSSLGKNATVAKDSVIGYGSGLTVTGLTDLITGSPSIDYEHDNDEDLNYMLYLQLAPRYGIEFDENGDEYVISNTVKDVDKQKKILVFLNDYHKKRR